jgi:hypothetical protein
MNPPVCPDVLCGAISLAGALRGGGESAFFYPGLFDSQWGLIPIRTNLDLTNL